MSDTSDNLPANVPAVPANQKTDETHIPARLKRALDVFLKLVAAIPESSPLRESSGLLLPFYAGKESFGNPKDLWRDIAHIAFVAVQRMTSISRAEGMVVKEFDDRKIIVAFAEALTHSSDHEKIVKEFSRTIYNLFEDESEGPRGFTEREDFWNWQECNELANAYRLHLRPEWQGVEDIKRGRTFAIAINLVDQILRRRDEREGADAPVPARVFATIRVLGEYLAKQHEVSLIPEDKRVLDRYIKFEFRWANYATVSKAVMDNAKEQAEIKYNLNKEANPAGPHKPTGKIFEEIFNRMYSDYCKERPVKMPETINDIPTNTRQSVTREMFWNRFERELKGVLDRDRLEEQINRMMQDPDAREFYEQLIRPEPETPGTPALLHQRLLETGI